VKAVRIIKELRIRFIKFIHKNNIGLQLRKRKLRRSEKSGKSFIARMPGTHMKMVIEPRTYLKRAYIDKSFEKYTIRFIRKVIKKGMVVVDVGANVGYFTLFLSKLVGKTGNVYAFEPTDYTYKILEKNIKINKLNNIKINQAAVTDRSGYVDFFEGPNNFDVYNTIGKRPIHYATKGIHFRKKKVKAIRLDDYFRELEISEIDFIKIDVEGAELNVLKGMKGILINSKDIILLYEVAGLSKNFGYTNSDIFEFLKELGFKNWYLDHRGCLVNVDSTEVRDVSYNMAVSAKNHLKIKSAKDFTYEFFNKIINN